MTNNKRCPIYALQGSKNTCIKSECAWWVVDMCFDKEADDLVDDGWCSVREIASNLQYLQNLGRES